MAVLVAIAAGVVGLGFARRRPAFVTAPSQPGRPLTQPASEAPLLACLPKFVGEKLSFEFGWQGLGAKARIAAAKAEAEVVERTVDGERQFVIQARAHTEGWVAALWKMNDRVESVVDGNTFRVDRYVLEQRENDDHTKTTVTFVPNSREAITHKVRYHKPTDDPRRETESRRRRYSPLDPASLAYAMRGARVDSDRKDLELAFFDGKYTFRIHAVPLGREAITVKAGEFDALKLKMRASDVDRPPKPGRKPKVIHAVLWVSSGPERIPLRLESETFVGQVYGELTDYTPPEKNRMEAGRGPAKEKMPAP